MAVIGEDVWGKVLDLGGHLIESESFIDSSVKEYYAVIRHLLLLYDSQWTWDQSCLNNRQNFRHVTKYLRVLDIGHLVRTQDDFKNKAKVGRLLGLLMDKLETKYGTGLHQKQRSLITQSMTTPTGYGVTKQPKKTGRLAVIGKENVGPGIMTLTPKNDVTPLIRRVLEPLTPSSAGGVKLLNGTPLLPGSELCGKELARTPTKSCTKTPQHVVRQQSPLSITPEVIQQDKKNTVLHSKNNTTPSVVKEPRMAIHKIVQSPLVGNQGAMASGARVLNVLRTPSGEGAHAAGTPIGNITHTTVTPVGQSNAIPRGHELPRTPVGVKTPCNVVTNTCEAMITPEKTVDFVCNAESLLTPPTGEIGTPTSEANITDGVSSPSLDENNMLPVMEDSSDACSPMNSSDSIGYDASSRIASPVGANDLTPENISCSFSQNIEKSASPTSFGIHSQGCADVLTPENTTCSFSQSNENTTSPASSGIPSLDGAAVTPEAISCSTSDQSENVVSPPVGDVVTKLSFESSGNFGNIHADGCMLSPDLNISESQSHSPNRSCSPGYVQCPEADDRTNQQDVVRTVEECVAEKNDVINHVPTERKSETNTPKVKESAIEVIEESVHKKKDVKTCVAKERKGETSVPKESEIEVMHPIKKEKSGSSSDGDRPKSSSKLRRFINRIGKAIQRRKDEKRAAKAQKKYEKKQKTKS